MMQAIRTRYHGPTNTRQSRISAAAAAGRVSVWYDFSLSLEDNHRAAATSYVARQGWVGGRVGRLVGGQLSDGDYAWTLDGYLHLEEDAR